MSWQDQFTAYTTGMAFNISLSHDHADVLTLLGAGGNIYNWRSRNGRSNFVPCVNGLIRRGLVEHNSAAKFFGTNTPNIKLKWVYRLTPAGERVLELLKLAGIASSHHAASEMERAS